MFENREGRWSVSGHNFDKLRRRVRAHVIYLCRRYNEPVDTADEITQRTFEKYFSKPRDVDINKDPFLLLCKIANGVWIDYCRKRSREEPQGATPRDQHIRPSQDPTPQQKALESETSRRFYQTLEELTPTNRKIAFCRARLNLSWHQIGMIVGLSTSAVESRVLTVTDHADLNGIDCADGLGVASGFGGADAWQRS
ncbi:sigma-70 family RNA polymerase sigma factor [Haloechinothrix salitolerans]|uniref:RNA polymerase sigma factor n=1 Tax=Haloechinothrix salitolerans TaxID=926830 RepID=A0ABW2BZY9_9PSEU